MQIGCNIMIYFTALLDLGATSTGMLLVLGATTTALLLDLGATTTAAVGASTTAAVTLRQKLELGRLPGMSSGMNNAKVITSMSLSSKREMTPAEMRFTKIRHYLSDIVNIKMFICLFV